MTLNQWHKYSDAPIFIMSLIFLFAYSWQIIQQTHLFACAIVINIIWVCYGIDYVVSLILAPNRSVWFRNNLFVLITLILPVFKPLRLLRLVTMLHMFNRSAGQSIRGRITIYTIGAVLLLVYVGALAEYQAEHNARGATITSFPLALWWAFVTVTTVGYGDTYPVTMEGRCIAVILMLTGIALIGIVSAMIGSWLIDQVNQETRKAEEENSRNANLNSAEMRLMRAEMLRLADSVSQLNKELERSHRIAKKHQKHNEKHTPNSSQQ